VDNATACGLPVIHADLYFLCGIGAVLPGEDVVVAWGKRVEQLARALGRGRARLWPERGGVTRETAGRGGREGSKKWRARPVGRCSGVVLIQG